MKLQADTASYISEYLEHFTSITLVTGSQGDRLDTIHLLVNNGDDVYPFQEMPSDMLRQADLRIDYISRNIGSKQRFILK